MTRYLLLALFMATATAQNVTNNGEIVVLREAQTGKVTVSWTGVFANITVQPPDVIVQPPVASSDDISTELWLIFGAIASAVVVMIVGEKRKNNGVQEIKITQ